MILKSQFCYFAVLNLIDRLQGVGQYSKAIKSVEEDIQNGVKKVNELAGMLKLTLVWFNLKTMGTKLIRFFFFLLHFHCTCGLTFV